MKKSLVAPMLAFCALATAQPASAYVPATLKVGFAPWENPQDLAKVAGPMVELLSKATGMKVEARFTTDYSGVVQAMKGKSLDVAFFPPAAYVLAEKNANAKVLLKSQFEGRAFYYSTIFTRKGSGIKSVKDLKGKSIAFVDPTSTSGAIYPKLILKKAGINPERDFKQVLYAGTHEGTVLAVLRGKVDAGAAFANDPKARLSAWNKLLKNPKDREQIQLLAISQPIPADNLAVRKDLDPKLTATIKKAFLDLSATPEGRARIKQVYHVDGFMEAKPSDYDPVREAFAQVGMPLK